MPLFRAKTPPPAPPPPVLAESGPHLLFQGPLLARWYIERRLHEELTRASRYGRHLAVLFARPTLLAHEALSEQEAAWAADAARGIVRATDLVGRWDDSAVIIVLPEADPDAARVTAQRFASDMWLRARYVTNPVKWSVRCMTGMQELQGIFPEDAAETPEAA